MKRSKMAANTVAVVVVLAVGWGCTGDDADDAASGEMTLDDAVAHLGCEEETSHDFAATFGCTVAGEPIALHKVAGAHQERLRLLSARYSDDPGLVGCEGQGYSPVPKGIVVVDGSNWIAVAGSPNSAARLVDEIGGSVQPDPEGGTGPPVSYDAHRFWDCPSG